MSTLRRLVNENTHLAWCVVALALAIRLAIPAGFMPSVENGAIRLAICSGTVSAAAPAVTVPAIAVNVRSHTGETPTGDHANEVCSFATLVSTHLAAADPIVLALGLAFIVATAFRVGVTPVQAQATRQRPPTRAPPAVL